MKKIFVANNAGLGDYILMNGATRFIVAQEDVEEVVVLCMADNDKYQQIRRMYSDNPSIKVIGEPHPNSFRQGQKKIRRYRSRYPEHEFRTFFWGTGVWAEAMRRGDLDPDRKNCWPELFYQVHGAPYSARHEHFYVRRDYDREAKLMEILDLPSEYALCIDEGKRPKFNLTPKTSLFTFKPHYRRDLFGKYCIWDWMGVVEAASEIYTIDTGWMHLLKSMRLDKPKFYYNVRHCVAQNVFTSPYINDEYDYGWTIINEMGKVLSS
jgi:hypothetical protein